MTTLRREERVGRIARRQGGVISRAQLTLIGVSNGTVAGWIKRGYLTRVHPKVYAVGHTAPSREADLWAAVLYAGPGAMLSHTSAAHHRGMIIYPPDFIHVSTPREKVRSIPNVVQVHAERDLARGVHDGIPTTTVAQTVLDLAAVEPALLARALATLDYTKQLDVPALERLCGNGRRGSAELRKALKAHQPRLAYANGKLEERFLSMCERYRLPLPRLNVRLHGHLVDAYWPEYGLVVELDGHANHSSPAQLRRDRARDLELRGRGLTVRRYDWHLVHNEPEATCADLLQAMGR